MSSISEECDFTIIGHERGCLAFPKCIPDIYIMFEFPCIVSLYYIKNQQDETLAVSFISHCKITLHVSDTFCVHHQEY